MTEMIVEELTIDKMIVDKMTVDKMIVDKMTVDKMTVDKMTLRHIVLKSGPKAMRKNCVRKSVTQFFKMPNTQNLRTGPSILDREKPAARSLGPAYVVP